MNKPRVSLRLRERLIFVPLVERALWDKYFDDVEAVEDRLHRAEDRLRRGSNKILDVFFECRSYGLDSVNLKELAEELMIES